MAADRAARARPAILLALLPLAAACAPPRTACPPGTEAATIAEAYLGRNVQGREEVSEAEWRAFLAATVTPAFPDGLTALDGLGQWRSRDGRIGQERSKVLVVVLPGRTAAEARARMQPVEEAWKARFRQQSVLTAYRDACVAF